MPLPLGAAGRALGAEYPDYCSFGIIGIEESPPVSGGFCFAVFWHFAFIVFKNNL